MRQGAADPLDPGGNNLACTSDEAHVLRQPVAKLKVPQARHFDQWPPDAVHQIMLDQLVQNRFERLYRYDIARYSGTAFQSSGRRRQIDEGEKSRW